MSERPVVVLPIRCSTVKSLDKILDTIIAIEILLVGIADLLYIISDLNNIIGWFRWWWWNGFSSTSLPMGTLNPVTAALDWTAYAVSIITLFYLFVIIVCAPDILKWIYNKIPRLECIKDETKSQEESLPKHVIMEEE